MRGANAEPGNAQSRDAGLDAAVPRRALAGTLRGRMGGDQLLTPSCCFLKDHKGRCLEASSPQRGPCPDTIGKRGGDSSPRYRLSLPSRVGKRGSTLGAPHTQQMVQSQWLPRLEFFCVPRGSGQIFGCAQPLPRGRVALGCALKLSSLSSWSASE